MKRENGKRYGIRLLKFMHYCLTLGIFYICWLLFRYGTLRGMNAYGFRYNYYVLAGYGICIYFFNRTYNAYLLGYMRIRELAFSQFLSQFFSAGIVWLVVCAAWDRWRWPWYFFAGIAVQAVLDAVWSYLTNGYFCRCHPPKKTILIYRNERDKRRFGARHGKPTERLYTVEKELRYEGHGFTEIRDQMEGYEAIFVAGVHSRCRNGIAKYCKEKGIVGFFLPHVGDVIMQGARHIQTFDSPVLYVSRAYLNPEYALIKRLFDVAASVGMMILLSPVILVTAAAIHFYDGGPAIYKQVRLTEGGREFEIYKFRSMRVDAEKDGVARLSTGENDDRITPIGRWVRKARLDEIPQLWNIAKGDMSFVGPRPERPEIAEQYYETLPDFRLRLQVKAGLTGYAQVYGKYNTDPYEKLEFDLLYINNMNVFTDLRLLFATFGILFKAESTEGIAEGQFTAMDYEEHPADGDRAEEDAVVSGR